MHMTSANVETGYVDKRKALSAAGDASTHIRNRGMVAFVANGAGTTTTIVGANATPGTSANVVRIGEKFVLYTGAGALKQETVFTVTGVAVAGSTTVTFAPAAAGATASGDVARFLGLSDVRDEQSLDARLLALTYTQSQINQMTQNDKIYAVRLADDAESI